MRQKKQDKICKALETKMTFLDLDMTEKKEMMIVLREFISNDENREMLKEYLTSKP